VAVQLVLDLQVAPAGSREMHLVVGEEVAIGILGCPDQIDELFHQGGEPGIRVMLEDARSGVQPFVGIRIREEPALPDDCFVFRQDAEVVDTA